MFFCWFFSLLNRGKDRLFLKPVMTIEDGKLYIKTAIGNKTQ